MKKLLRPYTEQISFDEYDDLVEGLDRVDELRW